MSLNSISWCDENGCFMCNTTYNNTLRRIWYKHPTYFLKCIDDTAKKIIETPAVETECTSENWETFYTLGIMWSKLIIHINHKSNHQYRDKLLDMIGSPTNPFRLAQISALVSNYIAAVRFLESARQNLESIYHPKYN